MKLPSPEEFEKALDAMDQKVLHDILETELKDFEKDDRQSSTQKFEIILDPEKL